MKNVKHSFSRYNTYDYTRFTIGNKDYNQSLYAHDTINALYSSYNR